MLACAWPHSARAQETAVPTVDDAPSAALLLVQASDQAAANPREAVRLLRTVLDDWGTRPIATPDDPNLFVSAGRQAEALLLGNAALLEAFRREENVAAQALLAEGSLEQLVATRLVTDAGLEAALRLAQSALSRGNFNAAVSVLTRAAPHPTLAGLARVHHGAMLASALARLGDAPGARAAWARAEAAAVGTDGSAAPALAAARREVERAETRGSAPSSSGASGTTGGAPASAAPVAGESKGIFAESWGEIWSASLGLPSLAPLPSLSGAGDPSDEGAVDGALAMPAADLTRVYADDGSGVRAFDRLSGRPLWSSTVEGADANLPILRFVAVANGAVVSYEIPQGAMLRGGGRVMVREAATGALRWESSLELLDGRAGADNLVPVGEPLVVDGTLVVAARRVTSRQESVTWLYAFDLAEKGEPLWASVVSSVGSVTQTGLRITETPVLSGGALYIATGTGAVARFDPTTGVAAWIRRFEVPLRNGLARGAAWDLVSPAVAAGRVLALAPDGASVVVLDAETGRELAALPTGPDTHLGQPRYLVGVPGTSMVLSVGSRVVALDASAPEKAAWTVDIEGSTAASLSGRVTVAASNDERGAMVVVPERQATRVVDAATGQVVLTLPCSGNPLLLRDQLLAGSPNDLRSMMPMAEAERLCRARMATDDSVDAALALVQLARQSRKSDLAAEGAREVIKRLALVENERLPELDDRSFQANDLLDLLLDLDAMGIASGEHEAAITAAIERAAAAVGRTGRSSIARAERLLRKGAAAESAVLLAELAMQPDEAALVEIDGVTARLEVHALARLRQAAQAGEPARQAVARVVTRRLAELGTANDSVDALRPLLRVAVAAGAAEEAKAVLARLRAVDDGAADRLAFESGGARRPAPPALEGAPARVVEFPGRLCIVPRSIQAPTDRVLTMQGTKLVLRKPPEFAPVWTAEVGAPDPLVAGIGDRVVVWDERVVGTGVARAFDAATGAESWVTEPSRTLLGERDPEAPMEMVLPGGRAASPAQVVPAVVGDTLLLTRRDGAVMALDLADGKTSRWTRASDDLAVAEFETTPTAVVIGGSNVGGDAVPRVLALDARTGAELLSLELGEGLAPTLDWIRTTPQGVLLVGSEAGVQAHRLGGGDESLPMWLVDIPDTQGSEGAWVVGDWLIVQGRFGQLVAIQISTGRLDPSAFRTLDSSTEPVRGVEHGDGWAAVVRESSVEFYSTDGAFLGRDVSEGEGTVTAAFASPSQLVTVDLSGDRVGEAAAQQFAVRLGRLDARSGGRIAGPDVALRTIGQRVNAVRPLQGWLLMSNGGFVQAVEFSPGPAAAR